MLIMLAASVLGGYLQQYFGWQVSPIFVSVSLRSFLSYGTLFAWFMTGCALLIQLLGLTRVTFGWINCLCGGAAYAREVG